MAEQARRGKLSPSERKSGSSRLHKSRQNRVIDGVCGGFGEYFAVDPTIIRIGWVLLALLWGSGIVAYVVAMIVMPRQPEDEVQEDSPQEEAQKARMWWAVLLIVTGLILLLHAYVPRPFQLWFWWRPLGRFLWPVLLVVIGLWILGAQLRKSATGQGPAVLRERTGKILYRSTSERMLAGVCGGLAEFLEVDPSIVRIIWALATLASVGLGVLVYLIMWVLVPEKRQDK